MFMRSVIALLAEEEVFFAFLSEAQSCDFLRVFDAILNCKHKSDLNNEMQSAFNLNFIK